MFVLAPSLTVQSFHHASKVMVAGEKAGHIAPPPPTRRRRKTSTAGRSLPPLCLVQKPAYAMMLSTPIGLVQKLPQRQLHTLVFHVVLEPGKLTAMLTITNRDMIPKGSQKGWPGCGVASSLGDHPVSVPDCTSMTVLGEHPADPT